MWRGWETMQKVNTKSISKFISKQRWKNWRHGTETYVRKGFVANATCDWSGEKIWMGRMMNGQVFLLCKFLSTYRAFIGSGTPQLCLVSILPLNRIASCTFIFHTISNKFKFKSRILFPFMVGTIPVLKIWVFLVRKIFALIFSLSLPKT